MTQKVLSFFNRLNSTEGVASRFGQAKTRLGRAARYDWKGQNFSKTFSKWSMTGTHPSLIASLRSSSNLLSSSKKLWSKNVWVGWLFVILWNKILKKSYTTIATGKKAFYHQLELGISKAYDFTSEVMAENMIEYNAQEGVEAFLQKRSWTQSSQQMHKSIQKILRNDWYQIRLHWN